MTADLPLVELVTVDGESVGASTVDAAHIAPGRLHRAFSVVLLDDRGRVLLQQRAAVKRRFPLRWANTCCGHPAPGEPAMAAANRRLRDELGLDRVHLTEVGVYAYRAEDPTTGLVELEYDHVLVGRLGVDQAPRPEPSEVAGLVMVDPGELFAELAPAGLTRVPVARSNPEPGGPGGPGRPTVDEPGWPAGSRYAPWLLGVLRVAGLADPARYPGPVPRLG